MTPEQVGFALELLREAGAKDVWLVSVSMKKGRPGQMLALLCEQQQLAAMEAILFEHTSTFGFRYTPAHRRVLEREFVTVQTLWGEVQVKVGRWQGEVLRAAPEFEDCRRLAKEKGVALQNIYAAAMEAWRGEQTNAGD